MPSINTQLVYTFLNQEVSEAHWHAILGSSQAQENLELIVAYFPMCFTSCTRLVSISQAHNEIL